MNAYSAREVPERAFRTGVVPGCIFVALVDETVQQLCECVKIAVDCIAPCIPVEKMEQVRKDGRHGGKIFGVGCLQVVAASVCGIVQLVKNGVNLAVIKEKSCGYRQALRASDNSGSS